MRRGGERRESLLAPLAARRSNHTYIVNTSMKGRFPLLTARTKRAPMARPIFFGLMSMAFRPARLRSFSSSTSSKYPRRLGFESGPPEPECEWAEVKWWLSERVWWWPCLARVAVALIELCALWEGV